MPVLRAGAVRRRLAGVSDEQLLSEGDIRDIFRHMLRGIAACHAVDICHGDLKPANYLVSQRYDDAATQRSTLSVKIADFGSACAAGTRLSGSRAAAAWARRFSARPSRSWRTTTSARTSGARAWCCIRF